MVAIMVTDDDGMSYGSGFILRGGPGGSLVVTCEHIVREATSIRVRRVVGVGEGGGVEDYAATMICKHREPDIALLRVPDLIQPSLALNLAVPQVGLNYPAISVGNACPADGPGGNWDGSTLVRLPSTLPGCIWYAFASLSTCYKTCSSDLWLLIDSIFVYLLNLIEVSVMASWSSARWTGNPANAAFFAKCKMMTK